MAKRNRNRNRWQNQDWEDQDYGSAYDRGTTGQDWRPEDEQESMYTETWYFIPGPYSGLGPKNYNRSDERIEDQVNERLTRNGMVDARNISVGVSSGEVTLEGSVHSRAEKRIAEDIAYSVFGVNDVHNQLKIDRQNERDRQEQDQGRNEWNEENEQIVEQHDWMVGVPRYWKDSESEQTSDESGQSSDAQAESWARNRVNLNTDPEGNQWHNQLSEESQYTPGRDTESVDPDEASSQNYDQPGMNRTDVESSSEPDLNNSAITDQPGDTLDQQRGENISASLDQEEAEDWSLTSVTSARADKGLAEDSEPSDQNTTHANSFASQDMYSNASAIPVTGGSNNENIVNPEIIAHHENPENQTEGLPSTGNTETATHIYTNPDIYTNDEQSTITADDIPSPKERCEGIQVGLDVIGSQGIKVGVVKEVRDNDFLLNRSLARDLYVPFDACQGVHEGQVRLNILAEDIDHQDWEKPNLL